MPVLFLLIGFALITSLVCTVYKKIWNKNLTTSISFGEDSVFEGQEGMLFETVSNRKNFPLPILHVKFQTSRNLDFHTNENVSVSDLTYKNDLFSIMPYQQIKRTLKFTALKRGLYSIDYVELVGSFLFFNSISYERQEADTRIYVYPKRIEASIVHDFNSQIIWSLMAKNRLYEDPFSFAGIREYEPFDPMKRINWKASAKTGDLCVNIFEYSSAQPVILLVNLQNSISWHTDNLLEESIRIAVTAAAQLADQSIAVNVLTNYDDYSEVFTEPDGDMDRINKKMAVIDLNKECRDYADWINSVILPNFNPGFLYAVISYDESPQMCQATEALALMQSELMLFRPYHDGDILPQHSARIKCFERVVNRNA